MPVRQGQDLGALVIVLVSLVYYGGAVFQDRYRCSFRDISLPWGNQRPGMIAAEITGSRDADGIYFMPDGTDAASVLNLIGVQGGNDVGGFGISGGAVIAISREGGAVAISEMPARRRLALGLPIDLNLASAEDLSQVPGIGEKTAFEIVQRRQVVGRFKGISDLKAVPGLKERKLDGLKKYLHVGATPR